ncbi:MAG: hypothetical protein LBU27_06930 [Candidatus Peribacteria bacterium]|jgi:hypothetical protein|nr:hypothetical protein [Candidatus Peribacteria bacterium]
MPNTLQQVVDAVYVNLSVDNDSETYPFSRVIDKIQSVIEQVCNRQVFNLIKQTIIKGGDLRFLRKQVAIEHYFKIPVAKAAEVGDTNIFITSATKRPQTGFISVFDQVF